MPGQSIRKRPFEIEYTSKPLSGWGGLTTFFQFVDQIGWIDYLRAGLPDGRSSNNQIKPIDIVRGLVATVLIGGNRFAHVDRIREDEVVRRISGAERLPGADAVRRYFGSFLRSQGEELYAVLQQLTWDLLSGREIEEVLDLDSTILDRYGEQEGVGKGYHPTRPGRRSHHPLLAMFANTKMIAHCWLRPGGASTHKRAIEFLDELLGQMPGNVHLRGLRADSGFFSKEYLQAFEQRGLRYAISMKMSQPVKRFCRQVGEDRWEPFDEETEVADTVYHPPQWPAGRRVVVVRSKVHPRTTESVLFDVPVYEYRAIVTTLTDSPIEVIRFYNKRGDCENRIKEFKNDFGARGFCLHSFNGTETVLRLLSALFNLVTTFKTFVLGDASLTLATVRTKVFVIGASIGRRARHVILRLGLAGRWRAEFGTLLTRATNFAISTAAQFEKSKQLLANSVPSPWRARRQTIAIV